MNDDTLEVITQEILSDQSTATNLTNSDNFTTSSTVASRKPNTPHDPVKHYLDQVTTKQYVDYIQKLVTPKKFIRKWSEHEIFLFYEGLRYFGTDFKMISKI